MAKKNSKKNLSADELREQRVAKMCELINKGDHGGSDGDAVTYLGSREVQKLKRFSSGDPEIDDALGGGWPKGRFIEIYGPESGGKSTLCLHAIAEHQKSYPDEDIALIDTEYSFDETYAKSLGVETRWLIVHQPENGEQALNVLLGLIKAGVTLIIVDSVAALTTKKDMEGSLADTQVAEQARLMSQSLRPIQAEAGQRQATIFWTNQIRDKIGVTWGDKTITPAGKALKFYTSIRCSIRRIGTDKEMIDGEEVAVASLTQIDVKKNKTAPPFRKAQFYISYGRGIDPVIGTFDMSVKKGVITKGGSWFSWTKTKETIGQGRYTCLQHFQNNEDDFERLKTALAEATATKEPVLENNDEIEVKVVSSETKKPEKTPFKKPNVEVEVEDV